MILAKQVLRFGDFTLKSGRTSPYFFNAGLINDGGSPARIGPGTPAIGRPASHSTCSSVRLTKAFRSRRRPPSSTPSTPGIDVPIAYNRKEAKAHGEGGNLVGAPLAGRVLIVDDVLTAGTAVRETIDLIAAAGAEIPGRLVLALDRQERGQGTHSAVQEISRIHPASRSSGSSARPPDRYSRGIKRV